MKICEHKLTKLVGEHTIVEWFEWAKDNGYEWAQSALDQYDNKICNRQKYLYECINYAFIWRQSKEGSQYWMNIFTELRNKNL